MKTDQNQTSKESHLSKLQEKNSSAYDNLTDNEKIIFLAGIFDGEGSFGLWSMGKNRAKVLRCEVGTSDYDMIKRFQDFFGGIMYEKTLSNKKHKQIFKWAIKGKHALKPLELMIPYMCKRRRDKYDGVVQLIRSSSKNGSTNL